MILMPEGVQAGSPPVDVHIVGGDPVRGTLVNCILDVGEEQPCWKVEQDDGTEIVMRPAVQLHVSTGDGIVLIAGDAVSKVVLRKVSPKPLTAGRTTVQET